MNLYLYICFVSYIDALNYSNMTLDTHATSDTITSDAQQPPKIN